MTGYGDIPIDGFKLLPYYSNPDTDLLVAQWWARMRVDGDLERLFTKDSRSLSALYRMMSPPTILLYKVDDTEGIWAASWFTPCMGGAFLGTYLSPRHRKSRDGLIAILEAHHTGLQYNNVLLGITKQAKMLDETRRLGYDVLGTIPHFWDGEAAWLVMLTRETWWRQTLPRYGRLIGVAHAAEAAKEVLAYGPVGR